MLVSRLFTIIGDVNVRRNMTGLNVASREVMKTAQVLDFNGAGSFEAVLGQVRPESSVCIIAAITDILMSNGDCGTIFASVDPILNSLCGQIADLCTSRPTLQVLLLVLLIWVVGNH